MSSPGNVHLFEKLPDGQRQRILDAGLNEFARAPYEQPSTNRIVEQAGIPKGTLFFYFGNKRGLFLYLVDDCIDRYMQFFESNRQELPADLFDRLLYIGEIKLRFALSEPLRYRMFYQAFLNIPAELAQDMMDRTREYAQASANLLLQGLDTSHFKAGIPVAQVVAMITLLQEGVLQNYQSTLRSLTPEESLKRIDQITGEFKQYFDWLKYGVYLPETNSTI
jgi:AcrR family transcriptional regulator